MTETMQTRCSRLDLYIAHGRLIRDKWRDTDARGRELACLLVALVPEVMDEDHGDPDRCPADVMPTWLAHMTPNIDDAVSDTAWPNVIRRYAELAHRWHVLDPAGWRRAEYRVREACVREAMRHTQKTKTPAVCEVVAQLCARVVADDEPSETAWAEARTAAASASAVWSSAEDAGTTAAWAAETSSSWKVDRAASWAAVWCAKAAAPSEKKNTWDRITTATLDALEVEIERKQLEERA